ncbi:MAG: AraC family transcriptional regulator [Clostridiales bacterium]|jgi:AraC family L-rhamnose operon transcriptional activator RhaR|nr:AraC family transcriptional regulator [Clostridiales bacterium]
MRKVFSISTINPDEMIGILIDDQNKPEEEHTHEFIEIEYVLSGSGVQIVNGVEYKVCKGDMLFFNIGDKHSYYPTDKMEILNCIFYPSLIDKEIFDIAGEDSDKFPPLITFSGNEVLEIERLITAMRNEYDAKESGYLVVLKGYLDILLVKILRAARQKTNGNKSTLSKVFNFIENHYAEISASDVAYFSSYNPSYLSKMFKDGVGITLTEYINTRRINEAIRLIRETDYSIEHICNLVGYKDKKHFYKLFKKATGVTPSKLREEK